MKVESKLTNSMIRARLDCLIFFYVQDLGGYYKVIDERGKPQMLSRLTTVERLNFPSVHRVGWAVRRVRSAAPSLAAEYRLWHEARRRYLATRSKSKWEAYVANMSYKSAIAIARRGGEKHYRNYVCRYLASELKPRLQEAKRARREMQAASDRIAELRVEIFDAMGVPEGLRAYA